MKLLITDPAKRQLAKLPPHIKKKITKQLVFLLQDFRHPSLRTRKMGGETKYEARVDYHYRFTFEVIDEEILILAVGQHDRGLGKK